MSSKLVNIESKNVLARLMATENIHVEHKKVSTASFDVKNRVLRLPLWKDMNDTMYEGLIGHEVGHALYTPHKPWVKFAKENPSLKAYANILEDARIERKMKIKYPGMKRTFFQMYDALGREDFFGINGRDLDSYGLADRLNIHFKLGVNAEVPFSDEEIEFRNRVMKAETFEDILKLAQELGETAEKEAETDSEDMGFSLDDLDADSIEENDAESNGGLPSPPSSDSDESEEDGESGENNSDEGDDESEDESEDDTAEAQNGAEGNDEDEDSPDFKPSVPQPETQDAFDSMMQQLNDEEASEPIYLDLPKVDYKKSLVPWKKTFDALNTHWANNDSYTGYWNNDPAEEQKKKNELEFRVWKKDTSQIVNYMVKEFEMKQAATEYRRTSISRSGVLDMNKLHKYKTDEDIFKRVAAVKDGRNHALMMWVDWSGSMHGKMESTVKQLLTLVMFARKVGIPFRVMSFSNSDEMLNDTTEKFYVQSANHTDHLVPKQLGMHEYFSEKMSGRDFNKQLMNLAFLGKSLDYSGLSTPRAHDMSSTPLNEAIIAAHDMIADFKKETGKEKINAIFLTDGGADVNQKYFSIDENEEKGIYASQAPEKKHPVIRDRKTKRIINDKPRIRGRSGLTSGLLSNLAIRHKINVIGFHITDRKTINSSINYEFGYGDQGVKMKSFCTKNGYVGLKEAGYDTYFLVNDKALDKAAEFSEPDRNADGSVAKGKLRTQFRKFTSARKVNKMMLNEFVSIVA